MPLLLARRWYYLFTLPQVNQGQVILTGHSRNGKQSLIVSAFDERFAAVIASSAGALDALPTRVFPDWFHRA